MKYQRHYLSEDKNLKWCPLQSGIDCTSRCAWFDHEEQDCRKLIIQSEIKFQLIRIGDLLEHDKRAFKF